jgi:hypothetical protein
VGWLLASVFDFVYHQREPVYQALKHLHYSDAILAATEDPRMPFEYNWRVPIYEPALAPEVERFCQRYKADFPIRRSSFTFAVRRAFDWGMMWVGSFTWRLVMFEAMAERSEFGRYCLERWRVEGPHSA